MMNQKAANSGENIQKLNIVSGDFNEFSSNCLRHFVCCPLLHCINRNSHKAQLYSTAKLSNQSKILPCSTANQNLFPYAILLYIIYALCIKIL